MSKRIICTILWVCIVAVALCSCNDDKQADSAYAKSPNTWGDGGASQVVDIDLGELTQTITDSAQLPVTIGFGSELGQDYIAGVMIEAEGCIIEGAQSEWNKIYDDVDNRDVYGMNKESNTFLWYELYPTLYPKYHEQIMITFPEGECTGEIVIKGFFYNKTADQFLIEEALKGTLTKATIYYAKTQDTIAFSHVSVTSATENLNKVTENK